MNTYRPHIDGLRALAVLAVMFYHAGLGVPGGFIGVDVFFVISGYLITTVILQERARSVFSFAQFYERRARRILPALYLITAVTLFFSLLVLDPAGLKGVGGAAAATVAFAANFYFWRSSGGYFAVGIDKLPLIHLWSLGVEEQFYFFWPFLVVIASKRPKWVLSTVVVVCFTASLGFAEYASKAMPVAGFFLLPARMWELLGGALIAWLPPAAVGPPKIAREVCAAGGLALICSGILIFNDTTRLPSLLTVIPVVGTMAVLGWADGTWVGRALSIKPVVAVGLISYSAYLWHQPLLALVDASSFRHRTPFSGALVLLAALILAAASWHFVEQPFRDKHRVSRCKIVTLSITGAIVLSVGGALLWLSNGWPQRLSPAGQRLATMKSDYADAMQNCFFSRSSPLRFDTACREGTGPVKIVVLGDSHALALRPAFREISSHFGGTVMFFAAAGCPPVLDGRPLSGLQTDCAPLFIDARRWLRNHPDITTVVLAARWPYYLSRTWPDNERGGREMGFREAPTTNQRIIATKAIYAASVRSFLHDGLQVVLVYPIPEAGWDVPAYLIKAELRGIRNPEIAVSHDWFRRRSKEAYAALDAIGPNPALHRVYPAASYCSGGECRFSVNGRPLFFDANHPNDEGARLALTKFPWSKLNLPLVVPSTDK